MALIVAGSAVRLRGGSISQRGSERNQSSTGGGEPLGNRIVHRVVLRGLGVSRRLGGIADQQRLGRRPAIQVYQIFTFLTR